MPTPDYELLVLSDSWTGLPVSCKHLVAKFLNDVPVTWVETIGLRSPCWSRDLRRVSEVLRGWTAGNTGYGLERECNPRIVRPVQIPYNHIGIIKAINHLAMLGTLRSAMPRSVAPRVVLTNWPFLDHLVGALQETVFIYYRVDDYAEMPGVKRSYIRKVEDRLMDKADLIVATSQGLVPEGRWRAKGRYLPHGVDFEHFRGGKRGQCGALSQLPSPRIGFFGLIDDWVDVELVEELAAAHPEWQFILAGRCRAQVGSLEVLKNVHVIGQVDYRQLPDVGAEFDVGVIPFRLNALTLCVNPLKLLEYFALGLPVVGVRLPEVVNFEDKVLLADNADEFARRIEDALGESGEVRRAARQKLASEHSWSRRATELKSWIADALGETKSARRPE